MSVAIVRVTFVIIRKSNRNQRKIIKNKELESDSDIKLAAIRQRLFRKNVEKTCFKKTHYESSFKFFLSKIEELQRQNVAAIRIQTQLNSDTEREECLKRK